MPNCVMVLILDGISEHGVLAKRQIGHLEEENLIEKYSTSRGEIALFITAHSLENNFRTAHIQTFSWKGDIHVDENIKSGKPKNALFNFVYVYSSVETYCYG